VTRFGAPARERSDVVVNVFSALAKALFAVAVLFVVVGILYLALSGG